MNRIDHAVDPKWLVKGGDFAPKLLASPDFTPFRPKFESQNRFGYQNNNCVQESFETILQFISAAHGKPLDGSQRYLGWASGCIGYGNSYQNCIVGFIQHFICREELWPWVEPLTREQYYAIPSDEAKADALERSKEWVFSGVFAVEFDWEEYRDCLLSSPIWFCNMDHSMVIFAAYERGGRRYVKIQDSFPGPNGDGVTEHDFDNLPWKIEAAYGLVFTPRGFNQISMTKEQFTADFCRKHERKFIRLQEDGKPGEGAIYLVLGANEKNPHGRVMHVSNERFGAADHTATYQYRMGYGDQFEVTRETLDQLVVIEF